MIRRISLARLIQSIVVLCILALFACPSAYAQSDDAPDIEDRWALQFGVTPNFTLGDFQGSLISAKKQDDERRAFRFGLEFDVQVSRMNTDRDVNPDTERDRNSQFINATAQWIRYPVHEGDFRAYWGLGPTIGLGRDASSQEMSDMTNGSDSDDDDRLNLNGGAIGVLGVEWFLRSRLSLSAEYRAGLSYQYVRRDQGSTTDTQHAVSLGSRGVLFGVSVYF